jgi:dethiobiotin synthetase
VEASEAAIAAICPWRFLAPLAPDAAARAEHRTLPFAEVRDWCVRELAEDTRPTLVEGAGGVMSPIAEDGLVLDLVTALGLPSLLVTGVYLGAITHTLTALAALRGRGCGVRAVVVNRLGASEAAAAALCEALRSHDRDASPVLTLPEALADWTNGLAGD